MLEIDTENHDTHSVCRPKGELDAYTVGQFRDALQEVGDVERLIIDLSEVPFMDSAGLGALIGGIRRTRDSGGEVAVTSNRPTITRLLQNTGFDSIVPVTDDIDGAIEALEQGNTTT